MQSVNNDEEYAQLLSNFSFIDDDIVKNYYNEMNNRKWLVKNENQNMLHVYLDYFNNNVNNFFDDQPVLSETTNQPSDQFSDQFSNQPSNESYTKRFYSCNHIDTSLGKPERIKKNDELIKNDEKCYICFHKFEKGKFKRHLPNCKHFYHKKCIDKWLKINARCPICRDKLI